MTTATINAPIGAGPPFTRYRESCSRCGLTCETMGFDPEGMWLGREGPRLPALARERQTELPVCDYCVAVETIAMASDGASVLVYLDERRKLLTTWGGTTVGRLTYCNVGKPTTWGRMTYWQGEIAGRRVYGRTSCDATMACLARKDVTS